MREARKRKNRGLRPRKKKKKKKRGAARRRASGRTSFCEDAKAKGLLLREARKRKNRGLRPRKKKKKKKRGAARRRASGRTSFCVKHAKAKGLLLREARKRKNRGFAAELLRQRRKSEERRNAAYGRGKKEEKRAVLGRGGWRGYGQWSAGLHSRSQSQASSLSKSARSLPTSRRVDDPPHPCTRPGSGLHVERETFKFTFRLYVDRGIVLRATFHASRHHGTPCTFYALRSTNYAHVNVDVSRPHGFICADCSRAGAGRERRRESSKRSRIGNNYRLTRATRASRLPDPDVVTCLAGEELRKTRKKAKHAKGNHGMSVPNAVRMGYRRCSGGREQPSRARQPSPLTPQLYFDCDTDPGEFTRPPGLSTLYSLLSLFYSCPGVAKRGRAVKYRGAGPGIPDVHAEVAQPVRTGRWCPVRPRARSVPAWRP